MNMKKEIAKFNRLLLGVERSRSEEHAEESVRHGSDTYADVGEMNKLIGFCQDRVGVPELREFMLMQLGNQFFHLGRRDEAIRCLNLVLEEDGIYSYPARALLDQLAE